MRIFLIGNGSSLKGFDFDRLKGEDTFATNHINFIYPWTSWRPKYYLSLEFRNNDPLWDVHMRVNREVSEHSWFDARLKENLSGMLGVERLDKITWIDRCVHHNYAKNNRTKWPKEWHLPELCTAFTGMSPMIQIANELGYDEIFLIGCDLGLEVSTLDGHFAPYYVWPYIVPEDVEQPIDKKLMNETVMLTHEIANKCSRAKIYNATDGGELEVHERVSLEEIL